MTWWNDALPYRVAGGVLFFVVLGLRDLWRNPSDPARAREYAFLFAGGLAAAAFGIAHDAITSTISPDYFMRFKGIDPGRGPFALSVAWLAVRASYWVGLVGAAALLVANNPSPARRQLSYRLLAALAVKPLTHAPVCALLGAAAFAIAPPAFPAGALDGLSAPEVARCQIVWGIHCGTYLGATLGLARAVAAVRRERRTH